MNPYENTEIREGSAAPSIGDELSGIRLRYSLTFDDLMTFQKFHISHSPMFALQRRLVSLIAASGLAVYLLITTQSLGWLELTIVTVTASAIVYILFFNT